MGLDIRLPIGLLFTVIGSILTVFGAFSDPALYRKSLDINVNLICGLGLLAFGVIMIFFGRRGMRPPVGESEKS